MGSTLSFFTNGFMITFWCWTHQIWLLFWQCLWFSLNTIRHAFCVQHMFVFAKCNQQSKR
jgi:hypothetical protein